MKRHNAVMIALLVLAVVAGFWVLQFPLYISSDSTKYLIGARFLAQGKGYIEIADGDMVVYNRRWPPAYSAFIALGIKAGLSEVQSARLVNFVAWCVLLLTWMAFFQRIFSPPWATVAYFLLILSYGLWVCLGWVLSETLFVAFLGLVGWSLTIAMSPEQKEPTRTKWLILGALALMGVGLTRYAGLPIIVATMLAVLIAPEVSMRERLRAFLILMIIALGGNILWMLRNKFLTGMSTLATIESLTKFPQISLNYILDFWGLLWREGVITPERLESYSWIFLFPIILFGIMIWCERLQLKKLKFAFIWIILSLFFYLLMLFTIQTDESRYFWVIQPFMVAILIKVTEFLYQRLQGKSLFSITWCCYVILAAILILSTISRFRRCISSIEKILQRESFLDNATFEPFRKSPWVFQWVRLNYQVGNLMFSNFADFLYFVTNCPCWGIDKNEVIWGLSEKMEDIITKRISGGVKNIYLILYKDNLWRSYLQPWQEYVNMFPYQVVREDENAIIVRLQLHQYDKEGNNKTKNK